MLRVSRHLLRVGRASSRAPLWTAARANSRLPTAQLPQRWCGAGAQLPWRAFSTEKIEVVDPDTPAAEEEGEEPAVKATVKEGSTAESFGFQAETAQLLDIVTNSLYTDKEVFLRELISNASDALEKARHLAATGADVIEADAPLEIRITVDEEAGTITIADSGVGMSQEELHENLGTIARSGSKAFVNAQKAASGGEDLKSALIGQFGVGFYASFMVSSEVEVYSQSALGGQAHRWQSGGAGQYEVVEAEQVGRGTTVVLKLKEDCQQWASVSAVEAIIKKYSNFVQHSIVLNGKKVNTVQALWSVDKNSVTEDQHVEFYKYVAGAFDTPMLKLHFSADVPIMLQALFYVGQSHREKFGMGRMDSNVSLYSKKVMIDSKSEKVQLLPDWLRFVHGVVDSEDIPLNISREGMQDSALIQKISTVLTKRVIKFFNDEAKKDADTYKKFFNEYGQFLKEGVCTDFNNKADIAKLLRFESSRDAPGSDVLVSLDEYMARCTPAQKNIYYLTAPSRELAEASAYYEVFKKTDTEVLFMYAPIDDFVMTNLQEYSGRKLVTCESANIEDLLADSEDNADKDEGEDGSEDKAEGDKESKEASSEAVAGLSDEQQTELTTWMQVELADKLSSVLVTQRLYNSPAIVVDHESGSMRRMMKMVEHQTAVSGSPMDFMPKQTMEINPKHPVVVKLHDAHKANPEMARLVAEQLYDNALITAGLLDDSRSMLPRLNRVLEAALSKSA